MLLRQTKMNRKTKDGKRDSWGRSIALFTYLSGLAVPLSFLWSEKQPSGKFCLLSKLVPFEFLSLEAK